MINKGFMCIDQNKECVAFSFDRISMTSFETIEVTCESEIDIERIQGYIINNDNSICWDDNKWNNYLSDVVEPNELRCTREIDCFPIINRGEIWYSIFVNTPERELEFKQWYQAWLDAPATRIIPTKPDWIN